MAVRHQTGFREGTRGYWKHRLIRTRSWSNTSCTTCLLSNLSFSPSVEMGKTEASFQILCNCFVTFKLRYLLRVVPPTCKTRGASLFDSLIEKAIRAFLGGFLDTYNVYSRGFSSPSRLTGGILKRCEFPEKTARGWPEGMLRWMSSNKGPPTKAWCNGRRRVPSRKHRSESQLHLQPQIHC